MTKTSTSTHSTHQTIKKELKRKRIMRDVNKENKTETEVLPAKRMSDEPPPKKVKWINKQKVLILPTRRISSTHRHFIKNVTVLMPHHRAECKMERTKNLNIINEMCEMKNCNKTILFEGRKKGDLYMWLSNVPTGPCAKFLVENIYTMGELKMTGNCLKGSRPLLSFDENFEKKTHYSLLKELIIQIFGVPNHHPKSQPFFDHVYTFSILDNRIWFRNYQILTEDGGLAEIGPRFVLNPIKIFAASFGGEALWDNPSYISPAKFRQSLKKRSVNKYVNKVEQKIQQEINKPKESYVTDPMEEVFKGDPLKKAVALQTEELKQVQANESAKKKVTKRVKKHVGKKVKKIKIKTNLKKRTKS